MGKKTYVKEILILCAYFLAVSGLIMILDISSVSSAAAGGSPYRIFLKQLGFLIASSVVFFALWDVDIATIRAAVPFALIVSFILLAILFIPGVTHAVKGARRWFFLTKSLAVQPVEFVKIIWVVYLADYLDRHRKELNNYRILPGPLVILLVAILLVYKQPDFGSAIIFISIFLIVFFLADVPFKRLIGIVLAGLPFCYWAIVGTSYRKDRIMALFEPFKHSSAEGYQRLRSLIAVVSGGVVGKGAGSSTSKLMYLPCAHTDFIFSVICEEFGFLGAAAILLLFIVFVIIGFRMAKKCRDNFSKILIGGLVSLIALQAFANIGVALGSLPTKGLALPFMSYGGSNLLATFTALGLIITVYMESAERMLGE